MVEDMPVVQPFDFLFVWSVVVVAQLQVHWRRYLLWIFHRIFVQGASSIVFWLRNVAECDCVW